MQWHKILTPLLGAALAAFAGLAAAQNQGDETLLEMQKAFNKGDAQKLTALLPQARGHVLEPWAAYWELRARLEQAQPAEVEAFLQRWAGTYQEDRLRNDWLLLLGQRRDWAGFSAMLAKYRMRDDREVRCYKLLIAQLQGQGGAGAAAQVLDDWYAQRGAEDGCTSAAAQLLADRKIRPLDVWRKARLVADGSRVGAVRKVVQVVDPNALPALRKALDAPAKYLAVQAKASGRERQELAVLALVRVARTDPDDAARQLQARWDARLTREERGWLWGLIGQYAARQLSPDALRYFDKAGKDAELTDDMLAWKARAALRGGHWKLVEQAIAGMSAGARQDSTWVYWQARAIAAQHPGEAGRAQARALYQRIAGTEGFYEQLALEELGRHVTPPPAPAPLTAEEKAAARANPGLNRGLYAILLGLRGEGVREWNYTINLHTPGGMGERELLAAADFACRMQVWDRCINTSERTQGVVDVEQRFPMPYQAAVVERARDIGLDPAYVYGLIRQESRFIMQARSGVGASGLMQLMPATARWTAKKIGMEDFSASRIYDLDTNIALGTAYLKLALDDFDGSMALAAAAYNAGPGRPRKWRNGPVLDAAIWAENVPFTETRDYVKKVLANTVNYAAILTGKPQSLKSHLGTIGPRDPDEPEPNKDLP
jgi:soluble lytic murein transglycosylase